MTIPRHIQFDNWALSTIDEAVASKVLTSLAMMACFSFKKLESISNAEITLQ